MVGAGHSRYQPPEIILGWGEIVNVESVLFIRMGLWVNGEFQLYLE